MKYIKTICAIGLTLFSTVTFAHDFSAKSQDGQVFYFNITDAKKLTAEITYNGTINTRNTSNYEGEVTIPSKVKYKEKVYTVTGIDDKAFSGSKQLTSVIMPAGIEAIGDFAFEKCTNLTKIIFSGVDSKMGEGVFFGCTSISNVSLGSDWTTINLKMFIWSDSLKYINIPAKVKSIRNLKSLRALEKVTVDVNNSNFSSIDDILYDKEAKVMLGCPRAYSGSVKVAEGVESIYYGALIDCPNITQIDLPTSLKKLSYLEFSRMKNLSQVIMRNPEPIHTASVDGEKVFAMKVANKEDFKLIVLRTSEKDYEASICSKDGEYSAEADIAKNTQNVPLVTKESELVSKKQISGTKTFTTYE